MSPATIEIDVSAVVPLDGRHHVAVWAFGPRKPTGTVPLLFCLPGGSYTKAYWHLEVPGHPGYSFAEHMAAKGMLVVAVDHIGTGESSRHPRAADLTPGMRHHFYWDDVPPEVMAADDLTNTTVPGVCGPLSIVPFIASDNARRVECPVFIGLGERDSTPDHHDEPRAYASSSDVTLFILEKSAHCHNTAGTRHRLWDRLAHWVHALDGTSTVRV